MDKLILEIIKDIAPDEIERISTVTGFVVLIAKIIERVHKKKNLSYDDSKSLVELTLDILITSFEGRDIPHDLRKTLDFAKNQRMIIIELIDDVILVWDVVIPKIMRCCKGKKKTKMTKSYINAKQSNIYYVNSTLV